MEKRKTSWAILKKYKKPAPQPLFFWFNGFGIGIVSTILAQLLINYLIGN